MRRVVLAVLAVFCAAAAPALNVYYDKRTPEELRRWGDRCYLREQMEVVAEKICKALYGNGARSRSHENLSLSLYLAPKKGGNPAFASGRRITWKVGPKPSDSAHPGMGLLCHEMTHVLDMRSDGVFTEAMADWTRNYMVWYPGCSDPSTALNRRYDTLRGARKYGKYRAGANFIDFMTQNYGEGTIYKILRGYGQHGKNVWTKTFGKDLNGLVADWRQMETIYDPVFQWTYNGRAAGVVRRDKKFCDIKGISAEDSPGKAGAWLKGATAGRVAKLSSGNMTLALHGRFTKAGNVAIASLGSATEKNGKALLLATSSQPDTLAAHVVASVPGAGCKTVSTRTIRIPEFSASSHSIVLTTKGGDAATVIVDGKTVADIDMKTKCEGCSFHPAFAVGGMSGGFGVPGFVSPSGSGGIRLDDLRVFNRTFRARETANYAKTFGPGYRGGVATKAYWCGEQGGTEIASVSKWFCVNSIGERVHVLPTKDTDVFVSGKAIPSIPPKANFACKSFTIDGWAVADAANIDLRGVGITDVSDNARIITRNGRGIAFGGLRGQRVRLDGKIAVTGGMNLAGNLSVKAGSAIKFPKDPAMAFVKSISITGNGTVTLKPGEDVKSRRFMKIVRIADVPKDLTLFRLSPVDNPKDATFKASTERSMQYLGATRHK